MLVLQRKKEAGHIQSRYLLYGFWPVGALIVAALGSKGSSEFHNSVTSIPTEQWITPDNDDHCNWFLHLKGRANYEYPIAWWW